MNPIPKSLCLSVAPALLSIVMPAFGQLLPGHDIDGERRVTFRIDAPEAKEVRIINKSDPAAMGAAEYAMKKDAEGTWTVTTNPCRPGFHYYEVSVDGFQSSDPGSPMFFGWGKWTSGLEIPDEGLDFYEPQEVPHGRLQHQWYRSKTTGTYRRCIVYTPPGYGADAAIRYPVLYLQHGAGESELGWSMQGRANFIMDNLLAAKKAVPIIIVMDNGYAARPAAESPWRPRGEDNAFEQLVIGELIPMIDASFLTKADRAHRAIAGLSMGAGQAMRIGLGHPDTFSAVGAFSGGGRSIDVQTSFNGIFQDAAAFNRRGPGLWMGCGELDRGFEGLKRVHEALEKHGIKHTWHEGTGSHEWQVWRRHLHEFAQTLFK